MLKINHLNVKGLHGKHLIQDLSMDIDKGCILGLTGASGSGKTSLLKSITGSIHQNMTITSGHIVIDGQNLLELRKKDRREYCGKVIGYIPQNPMTAFNPRTRIQKQVAETLCTRLGLKKIDALDKFITLLKHLNLNTGQRLLESYPHELSGGMLQRIAITLTLSLSPKLILADEPTSALDEDNAQVLLDVLNYKKDELAILFVSHDIPALEKLCDNVLVMDQGRILESASMSELLASPRCTWTKALANAYVKQEERRVLWTAYE